jgi:serine/threonine protein kinase
MIGQTVSHYKITEKLGAGGMGEVYKAEDTKLKRTIALKFLPREYSSDIAARERFIHEAQAASALDHPNICTIYEIGEADDGQSYIAMAYYDGESLRDIIAETISRQPLPIDQITHIFRQLVGGLDRAHKKGIIHRDIKPANIIITGDGLLKIVDFGLAKLADQTRLTKTGSTLGTVAYMSPEQALGDESDQRSDIWSVGVVLYEMLTGNLPFKGSYDQVVIYSILHEEPQPVTETRAEMPDYLLKILNKTLAKDPAQRYQKISEILVELGDEVPVRHAERLKPGLRWAGLILSVIVLFLIISFGKTLYSLFWGSEPDRYKNSIAVTYFDNRSGQEDLDKILVDMLTRNLARYDNLSVVSSQRLYDILKQMGRLGQQEIDRSVATEIAREAGVNTMLLGSIIEIGDQMLITSELMDVQSGNILSSPQANGKSVEDIFSMVDLLTGELSNDLGVSSDESPKEPFHISDVTTANLEAYWYLKRPKNFFAKRLRLIPLLPWLICN